MKKVLLFLIIGIFLISSISALDRELPQQCGGDDQLVIPCLGDDELTFLAGLPPEEAPTGGPGAGPGVELEELVYEEEELIEPKFPLLFSIASFFGITELEDVIILTIFFAFMFVILFFIFYKKEKEKKKKLLLLSKKEEEEEKEGK